MTDKKMPQRKEVNQGVEGKYATTPTVKGKKKVVPLKCGGKVLKKK
jgi:hypothetical protein